MNTTRATRRKVDKSNKRDEKRLSCIGENVQKRSRNNEEMEHRNGNQERNEKRGRLRNKAKKHKEVG
jgi:hypothetical protein